MLSGRFHLERNTYSMYPLYNCTGSFSVTTFLPPENSKLGISLAAGATTGGATTGAALGASALGASIFGVSTLGGSGFGSSLGFSGSFFFSSTLVTVMVWIFLPKYPSLAAK